MRLLSLTVRNYRVHQDLTVEFDRSRTLIGGPNESGKSTLAEAAHRALFLRAKTGGSLQKEMTSVSHGGDPEVLLRFEAGGGAWELEKRFAGPNKGFTRLTRQGGDTVRDDEAEARLAGLLKSDTVGGRGAAGQLPELWSHLWVWQGRAADDPSSQTSAHWGQVVQHLQQDAVSAVLQSANDERVAARIAADHGRIFTANGNPRANSKPELARMRLEEASAALEAATAAAGRLAQAADDIARAEREIADINATLPKLKKDRGAAESRLQEVAKLRRAEEAQLRDHEAASTKLKELETHDRTIRDLQTEFAARATAIQPADEKLATLTASEESARAASQEGEVSRRAASEDLKGVRLGHELAAAAVAAYEKAELREGVARRAKEAATVQDELANLRSELAKLPAIDTKALNRLRKLDAEAGQASVALEAMATGVELLESGVEVRLDEQSLAPGESRILTEAGDLEVGEGTRLRIRPGGGTNLADARARVEAANDALQSALQAFAVPDLEQAVIAADRRQVVEQRIDRSETQWKSLGGESLATELAHAVAAHDAAQQEFKRRQELAADISAVPAASDPAAAREWQAAARAELSRAESADSTANAEAARLRERHEAAFAALAKHRDETAAARQELRDLEGRIGVHEGMHGSETTRAEAIAAARAVETRAAATLAATREALRALNPDLLQADIERFDRALEEKESQLRKWENQRLVARDRLSLDGSSDPEAELRHAEARHRSAKEAHAFELRHANAIGMLHQLFTSSREAIDNALARPLAGRIAGYLECIFGPGTEAQVSASASGVEEIALVRAGGDAFGFGSLSGGTREQTAAAFRLALAEILAADHDGVLPVIFDDAFAYSDPVRIQSLQRMLDLAARRGLQIIVLTCDPAGYSGFGAAEIRISG